MTGVPIYLRYSPTQSDGLPLELQRKRCESYCEAKGLTPGVVLEEPHTSARKTPLSARPEGSKLIGLARDNGGLVCLSLSRLFRNAADGLHWFSAWNAEGTAVHIVDNDGVGLDSSSPTGRLVLSVLLSIDEFEAAQTADRTRKSLRYRQSNGQAVSKKPPYGYANVEGQLVPRKEEQVIVQDIVRLSRRLTAGGIRTFLNEQGTLCRGRLWRKRTIDRVLQREADKV